MKELAEKYRILVALRSRREILEAEGRRRFDPEEAAERKRAFRALARRFPSALSELELPFEELCRREAIARRALHEGIDPAERAWLEAIRDLHLGLRLLLATRRWMRRDLQGWDEAAFLRFCQRFEARARARGYGGRGAEAWAEALGIPVGSLHVFIARPPGGRWRPHLERALGLSPAASA